MNSARCVQRIAAAILALGCAVLFGCAAKEASPPSANRHARSAPSAPVRLETVDKAAYDAAISKLRGKVVLVDFWATWCEPCVEQLPHTLALGEKSRDRGLAVVTVSCDEPSESERIAAFLTSKNAGGATNLISQFGGSSRTMEELEISNGALPFYKLYDRAGRLRQTFGISPTAAKQFTTGDIEAAVEQLLAQ
jgi:thiol-disulfide isomerase/thioredoxin